MNDRESAADLGDRLRRPEALARFGGTDTTRRRGEGFGPRALAGVPDLFFPAPRHDLFTMPFIVCRPRSTPVARRAGPTRVPPSRKVERLPLR
ncbi:hypothetical protein NITMOv2_2558 [Nitrospira moscoviensis]|uniref:Uncharacterized protein n=1 Tax=Nitrospira moscoviensis TaxID=42253 RepID=A0A0K2GDE6_NITMO|nr:hypothetical protein NITMOv2_2558 [Nitrospira moscoviensis]